MITSDPALFFDGVRSARRDVTIERAARGVRNRPLAGELAAEWAALKRILGGATSTHSPEK